MPFDIRNYKSTLSFNDNGNINNAISKRLAFIKYMDDHLPLINQECESLYRNMNDSSQEAFTKKLDAWKGLVDNLQVLCTMYNIKNAQCLAQS